MTRATTLAAPRRRVETTAALTVGDSHDLPRLALAAAAGAAAFVVAALATRALGPREWTLHTTSTRRLLAARAGGA